jgi:hypothetical protein
MLAPLVVVLLLAGLWTIYWSIASSQIHKAYAEAEQRLAARGISLNCSNAQWGGFPFRVERSCEEPRFSVNTANGPINIAASKLLMALQAYNPRHAIALLDGETTISGEASGKIKHERALASIVLGSDDTWQATLELPKIAIDEVVSADRLLVSVRTPEGEDADFAVAAEKPVLRFADGATLALDAADLVGSFPKAALGQSIAKYFAATGKSITITSLSMRQGELSLTGAGALGVDQSGYLSGRIALRIKRIDLLFENVKAIAHLSEEDARSAKIFVDLLQNGSTGDPQIDLIAKDGKLYWGPFKIAELRPLL